MTKHTPGPWEVGPQDWSRTRVFQEQQGSRRILANCDLNELRETHGYQEEALANARLIAAAPDLLAACRDVLEFLDNGTPLHPGSFLEQEIRAVVTRAES